MTLAGDRSPSLVRCAGAPRDLGLDQGQACALALQGLRTALAEAAGVRELTRDLRRHFPQLAERLEGMARGARVPVRILLVALARELGCGAQHEPPATRAGVLWGFAPVWTGSGATLVWAAGGADAPWRVRESRPENGLPSLEIVLPWHAGGVAGVNAAGLAVACTTLRAPLAAQPCAAPAFLLVQECLQRFESVEGAEEWCLHRPAGGRSTILLADARGGLGGVEVTGKERERLAAPNGILASPDAPALRPQSAAKSMATSDSDWPTRLRQLLQQTQTQPSVFAAAPTIRAVALDARARHLWSGGSEEPLHAFAVASSALPSAPD
ncbi:MAG TPA: hypothetical protein VEG67_04340 [Myxococcota bacterium]|nr:hypothetical protein [Myxococcota bacterium]